MTPQSAPPRVCSLEPRPELVGEAMGGILKLETTENINTEGHRKSLFVMVLTGEGGGGHSV